MGGAASRTQAAAPAPAAGRSGSIVGPNPQLDAETQEMIRETQRRGSGQQRKASWGLFTGGERRKSKEVVLSQEAELQTESYAEAMRLIKQQQEELARLRNENRKVQAELAAAKELLGDRDLARMDGRRSARDLRAPRATSRRRRRSPAARRRRRRRSRAANPRGARSSATSPTTSRSRPEVVPGDGVRDLIWNVCKENLLFSDLDDSCRDRLTDPFAPIECGAGEVVVRQGENGEHFYVVESGHLRVFVKGDEEEEESKAPEASSKEPWDLAMYESHDALGKYVLSVGACGGFGELALMYDTPRAATVIACGDCKLWAIKRSDCKSVLQSIQRAEMKGRVRFLRRVRIGAATGSDEPLGLGEFLTDQELARLASVLESEVVGEGEIIIRQGEPGNHFYIVEEGRVDVHRNEPSSGRRSSVILKENKLKHIETGGYFGERALINEPRAASVVAAARSRFDAVTAPLKPSVVVPEPNPDEDDFTLDLTEKEDDAARPDWCPRLPKTMHKWRPTKADDAVNELAAGSPKASPLGSGRRVVAAPYGSPGRGSLGSRRLGAGSPASSPSSPASPAARSLRD
ncbi:cGMP-dependent protein kinase [Aureococcus anophagefferens]|nr:cGMP-dependent protein kinase [Aureococcus anophagefferens]